MATTPFANSGTRSKSGKNHYIALTACQWRNLFVSHSEALSSVARILTEGPCPPAVVLIHAESKIRDRDIPEAFRYRYAIRCVVLAALITPPSEECPDGFELSDCRTVELAHFEDCMAALPYRERCVVFLRDVLGYSRRETALLLSMGDSQVDDSRNFGRNRLRLQGPVALERIKRYFDAGSGLAHDRATPGALLDYA